MAAGVLLAALAAIAFGVTTPAVAWAGHGVGPLATAALLYAGAAAAALLLALIPGGATGAKLGRGDAVRVIAIAAAGAAAAPAAYAWGLQRAGATAGALLLNLEAVFTVVLARLVHKEAIGRRAAIAVAAMVAGGAALALDASRGGDLALAGALAIAGATLGWAIDNTLTRPLAERDPTQVIAAKASLGAAAAGAIALARGEPWGDPRAVLVLLACGATGYGLSLRLYLLAQRRIGAARTGSVFALAPFVGAAASWATGGGALGAWGAAALALLLAGVWLHAGEHHAHAHIHEPILHEHPHRHDDGHHDHVHDPPVAGEHTHLHAHGRVEHTHEHAPDVHHTHPHGH
jgi:drug/metabolite transporter (DMT)-like permease